MPPCFMFLGGAQAGDTACRRHRPAGHCGGQACLRGSSVHRARGAGPVWQRRPKHAVRTFEGSRRSPGCSGPGSCGGVGCAASEGGSEGRDERPRERTPVERFQAVLTAPHDLTLREVPSGTPPAQHPSSSSCSRLCFPPFPFLVCVLCMHPWALLSSPLSPRPSPPSVGGVSIPPRLPEQTKPLAFPAGPAPIRSLSLFGGHEDSGQSNPTARAPGAGACGETHAAPCTSAADPPCQPRRGDKPQDEDPEPQRSPGCPLREEESSQGTPRRRLGGSLRGRRLGTCPPQHTTEAESPRAE
ncbi:uncharacterized protein LOC119237544 [Talpa occidentalis]|uniref:uncharacterized protein LOC119237544 n=1 Tax=Talpa occidentalis TaxID=50954 RepID=UPI00188FC036|nr:uncharacterized protein LOC119237544 [Talpa occidentalis]